MIEELYVNSDKIELGDTKIGLTLQVNDIAELKDRQSNFTPKFKIPRTPNNEKVFKHLGVANTKTNFAKFYQNAFYYRNGHCLIANGSLLVRESDQKYYYVAIYSGVLNFFELIEGKTLNDLDVSELNHERTAHKVSSLNQDEDSNIFYPWVNYGVNPNLSTSETPKIDIHRLFPVVKTNYLIEKIAHEAGYKIEGTLIEDDLYNRLITSASTFRTLEQEVADNLTVKMPIIKSSFKTGVPPYRLNNDDSLNQGFDNLNQYYSDARYPVSNKSVCSIGFPIAFDFGNETEEHKIGSEVKVNGNGYITTDSRVQAYRIRINLDIIVQKKYLDSNLPINTVDEEGNYILGALKICSQDYNSLKSYDLNSVKNGAYHNLIDLSEMTNSLIDVEEGIFKVHSTEQGTHTNELYHEELTANKGSVFNGKTPTVDNDGFYHNTFTVSKDFEVKVPSNKTLTIYIATLLSYGSIKVGGDNSFIEIEPVVNTGITTNQDVANGLPPIDQKQFFKTILQKTASYVDVDKMKKTLTIKSFNDLVNSRSSAKDWTSLIDFSRRIKTKYRYANYAQKNNFKYQHENSGDTLGDSNFTIESDILESKKDVIKIPFYSAREISNELGDKIAYFDKLYLDENQNIISDSDLSPCQLLYRHKQEAIHYVDNDESESSNSINYPIAYFSDTSDGLGLGFDTLIDKYYNGFIGMLKGACIYEIYLNLTEEHLINFDHFTLKYFNHEEINGYFYFLKIISSKVGQSSKCIIAKI